MTSSLRIWIKRNMLLYAAYASIGVGLSKMAYFFLNVLTPMLIFNVDPIFMMNKIDGFLPLGCAGAIVTMVGYVMLFFALPDDSK